MKSTEMQMLLAILVIAILIIQAVSLFELVNLTSYLSGQQGSGVKAGTPSYITIHATGTASAKPTEALLYVTAKGTGKTAGAATANLSNVLMGFNSTISKYIEGNFSNIKTEYYNVYNQSTYYGYYPYYNNKTYNGFIATEQITVKLPDISQTSSALGAISLINNTEVSSSSGTLSDPQITALRSVAFANAVQNATSQAEILTSNAILSTQNITVGYYNFYPLPYASGAVTAQGNGNYTTNPSFYSGTASVTESITIVFAYSKKQ